MIGSDAAMIGFDVESNGFDAAMIGFDIGSNGFDAGSDGSDIAIGDSIFSSEGVRPEVEVTENGIARKPRQFSSLPLRV